MTKEIKPQVRMKLGRVLSDLCNTPLPNALIHDMIYCPTRTDPQLYLVLADWVEENGTQEQQKVCAPAREIGKLLIERPKLSSFGMRVKNCPPITRKVSRHLHRTKEGIWDEAHVLGPKKFMTLQRDFVATIRILPTNYSVIFHRHGRYIERPANITIRFTDVAICWRGMSGSNRARFSSNAAIGDHAEVYVHPLAILVYAVCYDITH